MPTKWTKKLKSELESLFAEGLCNAMTPVGDAYDMSEAFKGVTKETLKRYFYKRRRELAEEGSGGGAKVPESK